MHQFAESTRVRVDSHRTRFLITIDTEGDDLWSKTQVITTRNAGFLHRFQTLCDSYELRPTYLVSFEMARSAVFQGFGRDVLRRGTGEIGMHLHAWDTPPLVPLTADDVRCHPYLIEYPQAVMQQKIRAITHELEDVFGVKMVSHRAGRWSFNEAYARALVAIGYLIDCSVTPLVSWRHHTGDPKGRGGTDYTGFPREAYFVDLNDVSRPGDSPLLEVPVTIVPSQRRTVRRFLGPVGERPLARKALNRFFPSVHWLRPNGRNRAHLLHILTEAVRERGRYVEFMLHSSELMPGGSPRFPRQRDIERLYEDVEMLFAVARQTCVGATLQEFYALLLEQRGSAPGGEGRSQPAAKVGSA